MAGVYEIRAAIRFSAAHWLRDYEGPCARMHGHSFRVEAAVTGSQLGPSQLLLDFHDLRGMLRDSIAPFDHRCLNEVEPFTQLSPTSENIARYIYRDLAERMPGGVTLSWVRVCESPDSSALYREG